MRLDRYEVQLAVDSKTLEFRGQVRIHADALPPEFSLNAGDLHPATVQVDGVSAEFQHDLASEKLTVRSPHAEGRTVSVAIHGQAASRGLVGPYRSRFGDGQLFTTMMYPTGCGRLFPCFDHPAMKAVFEVSVETDDSVEVVFNTSPRRKTTDRNRVRWEFAPTPRMSTYLIYLAVGPMEFLPAEDHGTSLRVAAPPGRRTAGSFALSHLGPILREFESYYSIPYPLDKLDLIAVPDYWAGAMENWGAISFAESRLLIDDATPEAERRKCLDTLAHEVAHQWFGNLVTNAWWSDFWLNESFATFAGAKILARLQPQRHIWTDFLVEQTGWALPGDSLASTHPIETEVTDPSQIGEMADEISYGKGGSVLRMIDDFLGDEAFRAGVTAYLRKFQYSNAQGRDLWETISQAAGTDVSSVMEEWVRRPGHPIVEVVQDGTRLTLTQRRFYLDGRVTEEPPWPIPLVVLAGSRRERRMFDTRTLSVEIGPEQTFEVNPGRCGFYRVRYEPEVLEEKIARLSQLEAFERIGLLRDEGAFLRAGLRDLDHVLDLLRACGPISDYSSIVAALALAQSLRTTLSTSGPVRSVAQSIVASQLERIHLDPRPGEDADDTAARGAVATTAVRVGAPAVSTLAGRFSLLDSLPADLRLPVCMAYGRSGGAGEAHRLLSRMEKAPSEERGNQFAWALGSCIDPGAFQVGLDAMAKESTPVFRKIYFFAAAASEPAVRAAFWEWFSCQLDGFARQARGTPLLSLYLPSIVAQIGLGRVEEVRRFFREHRYPEARRAVDKGLERLEIEDALRRRMDGA